MILNSFGGRKSKKGLPRLKPFTEAYLNQIDFRIAPDVFFRYPSPDVPFILSAIHRAVPLHNPIPKKKLFGL
jgi:hypothetical protein